MRKLTLSILAIAGVTFAGAIWQIGTARAAGLFDYTNATVIAQGEGLYQDYCASCHGANLEGEPNWRSVKDNGRAAAPPHDKSGHTWHHPDKQLFAITKFGTAAIVGQGYESDMAGFEDSLTDDQIKAVMAYIKSTWPAEIIEAHDRMNQEQG